MTEPIDMVLHCPSCGLQHIDAPDRMHYMPGTAQEWTNPPHRSHLCHGCGHIWRPADVPTNGVRAVLTKGKADSPIHDCRGGHAHRWVDDYKGGLWRGSRCRHCGEWLPF